MHNKCSFNKYIDRTLLLRVATIREVAFHVKGIQPRYMTRPHSPMTHHWQTYSEWKVTSWKRWSWWPSSDWVFSARGTPSRCRGLGCGNACCDPHFSGVIFGLSIGSIFFLKAKNGTQNHTIVFYQVWVADSMVTAKVARSQPNFSFMKSKSGPDVTNIALPLIKKPAPAPCSPSTLLLPKVIKRFGLWVMLASVLCMYPAGINRRSSCDILR